MYQIYKSKQLLLKGKSHKEVMKNARKSYQLIQSRTKRRAYLRSAYFGKQKVFINTYWQHLMQKNYETKTDRSKFLMAAYDLIQYSTLQPKTLFEKNEKFFRFFGKTSEGKLFSVQIKQSRNGRLDFISVFPVNKIK